MHVTSPMYSNRSNPLYMPHQVLQSPVHGPSSTAHHCVRFPVHAAYMLHVSMCAQAASCVEGCATSAPASAFYKRCEKSAAVARAHLLVMPVVCTERGNHTHVRVSSRTVRCARITGAQSAAISHAVTGTVAGASGAGVLALTCERRRAARSRTADAMKTVDAMKPVPHHSPTPM